AISKLLQRTLPLNPTIGLFLIATASPLFATPSGLNNIPTADTTPQGVFVSQAFSTLWEDLDTDLNFGFKTGIDLNILDAEVGFSAHLLPDKGGPTAFH